MPEYGTFNSEGVFAFFWGGERSARIPSGSCGLTPHPGAPKPKGISRETRGVIERAWKERRRYYQRDRDWYLAQNKNNHVRYVEDGCLCIKQTARSMVPRKSPRAKRERVHHRTTSLHDPRINKYYTHATSYSATQPKRPLSTQYASLAAQKLTMIWSFFYKKKR